ncbi:TOM1-like protein 1 [Tachyglossus aculeatus]|uniref:TOM1-like protein 1 n=1 Tax=Tachyglossus aculeatus TaxID=9261 RepID=UPI0018F36E35|nr:TOM1-like protein 1 [Tachyglossus aculeatus]
MAFGKSPKDPFWTPVGLLIEKSTIGTTQSENWDQFMHICNLINTTQEGPRDAVKALKKRLSKNCNHKEIRLTLSLLDTCMQNCGPSFRALVVKKDFAKDKMTELLNPRYNLPMDIQNQILTFIMTWSQGFEGTVDVTQVKELYLELLEKGVRFPSLNTGARTETRERLGSGQRPAEASAPIPSAPSAPLEAVWKAPNVLLVPEQCSQEDGLLLRDLGFRIIRPSGFYLKLPKFRKIEPESLFEYPSRLSHIGKLNSELDMVKMNVAVMLAILTENNPDSEDRDDLELLQKLYRTGRQMHSRIVELLAAVENEDVVAELIQVHENLSDAILRCERFSHIRQGIGEQNRPLSESIIVTFRPFLQLDGFESGPPGSRDGIGKDRQPAFPVFGPTPQQDRGQSVSLGPVYQDVPTLSDPMLPGIPLADWTSVPPSHPSEENRQLSNYYEVIEFDPLAPDTTEAVYEDIDAHRRGPIQN